ncbi:MAG: hypothetical protein D3919_11635 [Candidatus Electrothrix sp. AW5]|nr:hypothetical protein [Candidatus Electrothrix gigas]
MKSKQKTVADRMKCTHTGITPQKSNPAVIRVSGRGYRFKYQWNFFSSCNFHKQGLIIEFFHKGTVFIAPFSHITFAEK